MTGYVNLEEVEKYFNREEWRTPDEKWCPICGAEMKTEIEDEQIH